MIFDPEESPHALLDTYAHFMSSELAGSRTPERPNSSNLWTLLGWK